MYGGRKEMGVSRGLAANATEQLGLGHTFICSGLRWGDITSPGSVGEPSKTGC